MGQEPFAAWVLESLTSGVLGVDAAGTLVVANGEARRILGLDAEAQLVGRASGEALAARPAVARLLAEALARETPISRSELALSEGSGRPDRTLGFSVAPVRDAGGELRGAALVFRDLTPIEQRDEQERLRERLAALGEMAAGLAHALRNPLAGMEVVGGLLKRRLRERPDERALVDQLLGELRRAAATVTASLDFVRPDCPVRRALDLPQLLDEALCDARARAPGSVTVERAIDPGLPVVLGDGEALRTAFANLAVNAFEAMAEADTDAPRLQVRASSGEQRREVVVSLADNGPGIERGLREKVFYPFFTTRPRGSGIGLAQAHKIVAAHGGSLELESPDGPGCRFRMRLPADGEGAP